MTKSDLIAKVSAICPYMHICNVEKVISIMIDRIVSALKNGGRVELRGFGSFSLRERKKLEGRNPKTGEKVLVEARKVPFFRAGKRLKDLINGRSIIERS